MIPVTITYYSVSVFLGNSAGYTCNTRYGSTLYSMRIDTLQDGITLPDRTRANGFLEVFGRNQVRTRANGFLEVFGRNQVHLVYFDQILAHTKPKSKRRATRGVLSIHENP